MVGDRKTPRWYALSLTAASALFAASLEEGLPATLQDAFDGDVVLAQDRFDGFAEGGLDRALDRDANARGRLPRDPERKGCADALLEAGRRVFGDRGGVGDAHRDGAVRRVAHH